MLLLSSKDALYITPRSAKVILTRIGSRPISDDAVFAINGFLDELLYSLITYLPGAGTVGVSDMDAALVKVLPGSCLAVEVIQQARKSRKIQTPVSYSSALWNNPACVDHSLNTLSIKRIRTRYEQLRSYCLRCSSLGARSSVKSIRLLRGTISSNSFSPTVTFYVTAMVEYLAKYLLNSVGVLAKQLLKASVDLEDVLHAFSLNEQIKEVFMKMDLRKKLERKLGFKCKDNNRLSLLEKREQPFSLENISQVSNPITLIQSRIEVAEQKPFTKGKFTGAKLFTSIPTFLKRGKKDTVESWPPKPPSNPSHQSSDELSPASPKAEYFRFIPSVAASDEATLADSVVSVNGSALEEMDKNKKNFEFEELLESDSTQRVSLTTQRLRSIESRRRLNNLKPRDSIHKKMDIMEEQSDEGESSTMSSPNSLNEHYTPVLKRSQTLYEFLKTSNPEGSRQSGPAPRVEPFGKLIPREPIVSFKSILRNGDSSSDEDELSSVEGAAKYTYKVARRSRRNSETLHDFLKNSKPEDVEAGNIGTKVNRTLSRAGTQLQRIHHSIRRSATTRGKVQHQENNNTSDLTQNQISASARRERRRRRGLSVPTVFDITRFHLDEHANPSAEVMASPDSVSTSATLAANLSSPSLNIPKRVRPFSVIERRNTSSVHNRRRDVSSLLLSSTSEVSTLPPGTPSNLSMMRSNGDSENPDLYFISNSSKTRASKRYSVATNPPEMVIPFCLCSECLNGMLQHF